MSNDGNTQLFTENLGWNDYQNGDFIVFDIFDSNIGGVIGN